MCLDSPFLIPKSMMRSNGAKDSQLQRGREMAIGSVNLLKFDHKT